MTEVAAKPPDTREFERVVRAGGVVVFPTDTLYGIGCRPDDDVAIEGVSLVSNYRTQFNKILQTSSYQELVRKLKSKQEEFLEEQKRTSLR